MSREVFLTLVVVIEIMECWVQKVWRLWMIQSRFQRLQKLLLCRTSVKGWLYTLKRLLSGLSCLGSVFSATPKRSRLRCLKPMTQQQGAEAKLWRQTLSRACRGYCKARNRPRAHSLYEAISILYKPRRMLLTRICVHSSTKLISI